MLVLYYKTLKRNPKTNETEFLVVPKERMEGVKRGLLTCRGKVPHYMEGMPLNLLGKLKEDIFFVEKVVLVNQNKLHSRLLLSYLSKHLTDAQIEEILRVSENDIFSFVKKENAKETLERILKRQKNGKRLANVIYQGVLRMLEHETLSSVFLKYNLPLSAVDKMIASELTYETLKKEPYELAVSFKIPVEKMDAFALNEASLAKDSKKRLLGYIYDTLMNLLKEGTTSISFEELRNLINCRLSANETLKTSIGVGHFQYLLSSSPLVATMIEKDVLYVYLRFVKEEEEEIIRHVKRLQASKHACKTKQTIEEVEKQLSIRYNKGQKEAFSMLKESGIKILTGPPGSGKTAVIRGLIACAGCTRVALSATTGMAAKVMTSACKQESVTVHKLLEYRPYEADCKCKDLNDPIQADFIIVDECSMLGTKLCSMLLGAVKSGATLLLVGDEDQLPSVEYGNILHDLIASNKVEVYRLTEVLRQSGSICYNAAQVNHGNKALYIDDSFTVYDCPTIESAKEALKQNYHADGREQIITPTKKAELGTRAIHELFVKNEQEVLFTYGEKKFRKNDKIVFTQNNYEKGYINGEIGYITDYQNGKLEVRIENQVVKLGLSELADVEFADAITIHKAQGSEYSIVHIVLQNEATSLLSKKLIYTAITRAKSQVFIYNVKFSMEQAIENRRQKPRLTLLKDRLVKEVKSP